MTHWAKDGCASPFFLWSLRDFSLDMKEYKNADDYLESVLNPSEFQPNTEKHRIRKSLSEYFPSRGCLCFVRPLDSEVAIRQIEKHKLNDLRPQFQMAVEQFKKIVYSYLKPKRFEQKVLNGPQFAKLIKEILENFNSAKVPTVKSAIERLMESTKNEAVAKLNAVTDAKFAETFSKDPFYFEPVITSLWGGLEEMASKKTEKSLLPEVFGASLDYFSSKLEREAGGIPQFIKDLEKNMENSINEGEEGIPKITQFLENVPRGVVSGKWVLERVIGRGLRATGAKSANTVAEKKAFLEEKQRELADEKETTSLLNKRVRESASNAETLKRNIEVFKGLLNGKEEELKALSSAESDDAIRIKVERLRDEIENLEREKGDLMGKGGKIGANILKNSVFKDLTEGFAPSFHGRNFDELSEFFNYVKEAYLRENSELNREMKQLSIENFELKAGEVDQTKNDKILVDLKLKKEEKESKKRMMAQTEKELENLTNENQKLMVEKKAYVNAILELITFVSKKKKVGLKAALDAMNQDDSQEFKKLLADNKITPA